MRQHAVAALNLTQKAKEVALAIPETERTGNTALIDGVRKFAMSVTDLDIDLIDRINPFGEAYAILAKTMSEESLKQVAAVISARKVSLTIEEAREMLKRAVKFKREYKIEATGQFDHESRRCVREFQQLSGTQRIHIPIAEGDGVHRSQPKVFAAKVHGSHGSVATVRMRAAAAERSSTIQARCASWEFADSTFRPYPVRTRMLR